MSVDINMLTAVAWAGNLSDPRAFPESLQSVCRRAELVQKINTTLAETNHRLYGDKDPQPMIAWPFEAQEAFRSQVLGIANEFITESLGDGQKIGLGLRLWAGCLDAAKTIAGRTRSGGNTAKMRQIAFTVQFDPMARADKIYEAGIETAPIWKEKIGQGGDVSLDGVPENSPVRRYWNKKEPQSGV